MNIYDQPAQANFINTYSPIPFQEIVQAGTARQGRYDAQIAGLEGMVTESELLKAMPGDESYVQGVQNTAKEIANSFAKRDLSDPYVAKDLRDTIRKSIDKGMLSTVQESYVGYKQYQDLYNKQKAAGIALAPEDLSQYSTVKTGQAFSGLPQQRLDYATRAKTFFDQMDPTWKGIIADKNTGIPGSYSSVGPKDVNNQAQRSIEAFINSPEGKQYFENVAHGDKNQVYNYLNQIGLEQLKSSFQPLSPGWLQDPNVNSQQQLPTDESEGIKLDITPYLNIPNIIINKTGDLKRRGRAIAPLEWAWEATKSAWKDEKARPYSSFTGITPEDKQDITTIRDTYPSLSGKSDVDVVREFNAAVKHLSVQSMTLTGMSNLGGEDILKEILNTKTQRKFVIMDGYGVSEPTLTEKGGVLEELGMSSEEFDNYLAQNWKKVGGITQDGPEAGMFYIDVPDQSKPNKGKPRRVLISSTNELRNATASSYAIHQMINTLGTGVVRPNLIDPNTGQEMAYKVYGDINHGTYNYTIVRGQLIDKEFVPLFDEKGHPQTTTLTQIKRDEKAAIASPYFNILGTKLGVTQKGHIQ